MPALLALLNSVSVTIPNHRTDNQVPSIVTHTHTHAHTHARTHTHTHTVWFFLEDRDSVFLVLISQPMPQGLAAG